MFFNTFLKISLLFIATAFLTTNAAPMGRGTEIVGEAVLAAGIHHMVGQGFEAYKHHKLQKKIEKYYQENPDAPYPPPFLMNRGYMHPGYMPPFPPIYNNYNMRYGEDNQETSPEIKAEIEEKQVKKQESAPKNNRELKSDTKEQVKKQDIPIQPPRTAQMESPPNDDSDIYP